VAIAILLAVVAILLLVPRSKRPPPDMAPGATAAVRRALGNAGVERIVQVISPGNRPSAVSAGTHLASGAWHGRPYGLAFDIAIVDPLRTDVDVRALRLQGIAAWRRGPGAPGGGDSLLPHIHCVWPGAPTRNGQNREQVASFVLGYRGLADMGLPRSRWKDLSIRPDERERVRAVYERVNGRGSLARVVPYDARHRAG